MTDFVTDSNKKLPYWDRLSILLNEAFPANFTKRVYVNQDYVLNIDLILNNNKKYGSFEEYQLQREIAHLKLGFFSFSNFKERIFYTSNVTDILKDKKIRLFSKIYPIGDKMASHIRFSQKSKHDEDIYQFVKSLFSKISPDYEFNLFRIVEENDDLTLKIFYSANLQGGSLNFVFDNYQNAFNENSFWTQATSSFNKHYGIDISILNYEDYLDACNFVKTINY